MLLVLSSAALGQWRRVESGSLAWLHAIVFIDAKTGWIGGSNGTLLATSDGGMTWRKKKFPIAEMIRDIVFLNASEGWALCERSQFAAGQKSNRSFLMHTVDGGNSWSELEFQAATEPRTRIFFDRLGDGYGIGEGGTMTGLPRAGKPEKRFGLPLRYLMLDGVAVNASRLLLVGGGGSIIWTENNGKDWHSAKFDSPGSVPRLNAVAFADEKLGWAVGNDGIILSTSNGGGSWKSEKSDASANLLDVLFCEGGTGFAAGENGIILRSSDSGRTWVSETCGSRHNIERLAKAGDNVIAVGFGGTILVREIGAK